MLYAKRIHPPPPCIHAWFEQQAKPSKAKQREVKAAWEGRGIDDSSHASQVGKLMPIPKIPPTHSHQPAIQHKTLIRPSRTKLQHPESYANGGARR